MSHPNPSHDRSNEYPSDHYKPVAKSKALKKRTGDSIHFGFDSGFRHVKEPKRFSVKVTKRKRSKKTQEFHDYIDRANKARTPLELRRNNKT